MSERWHGTSGGYTNHKCRCQRCRNAWRVVCQRQRANRRARLNGEASSAASTLARDAPAEHGTESTYSNWGCRCADCTEAHRVYNSVRRR